MRKKTALMPNIIRNGLVSNRRFRLNMNTNKIHVASITKIIVIFKLSIVPVSRFIAANVSLPDAGAAWETGFLHF